MLETLSSRGLFFRIFALQNSIPSLCDIHALEWLQDLCANVVLFVLIGIISWIVTADVSSEPGHSLILIARFVFGLASYGAIGAMLFFAIVVGFKEAWADWKKQPRSAWKEIGKGAALFLGCALAAVIFVAVVTLWL